LHDQIGSEGGPCLRQEHAEGIQEALPGPRDGLEILVAELHGLDDLGSEEVVQMMVGSLAEEEELLHDHLQVLVYHPHLQGNLGEGPHGIVDCVVGALLKWGGPEYDPPGVVDLHQAEAVAAELSVSELSLQLPAGEPQELGC